MFGFRLPETFKPSGRFNKSKSSSSNSPWSTLRGRPNFALPRRKTTRKPLDTTSSAVVTDGEEIVGLEDEIEAFLRESANASNAHETATFLPAYDQEIMQSKNMVATAMVNHLPEIQSISATSTPSVDMCTGEEVLTDIQAASVPIPMASPKATAPSTSASNAMDEDRRKPSVTCKPRVREQPILNSEVPSFHDLLRGITPSSKVEPKPTPQKKASPQRREDGLLVLDDKQRAKNHAWLKALEEEEEEKEKKQEAKRLAKAKSLKSPFVPRQQPTPDHISSHSASKSVFNEDVLSRSEKLPVFASHAASSKMPKFEFTDNKFRTSGIYPSLNPISSRPRVRPERKDVTMEDVVQDMKNATITEPLAAVDGVSSKSKMEVEEVVIAVDKSESAVEVAMEEEIIVASQDSLPSASFDMGLGSPTQASVEEFVDARFSPPSTHISRGLDARDANGPLAESNVIELEFHNIPAFQDPITIQAPSTSWHKAVEGDPELPAFSYPPAPLYTPTSPMYGASSTEYRSTSPYSQPPSPSRTLAILELDIDMDSDIDYTPTEVSAVKKPALQPTTSLSSVLPLLGRQHDPFDCEGAFMYGSIYGVPCFADPGSPSRSLSSRESSEAPSTPTQVHSQLPPAKLYEDVQGLYDDDDLYCTSMMSFIPVQTETVELAKEVLPLEVDDTLSFLESAVEQHLCTALDSLKVREPAGGKANKGEVVPKAVHKKVAFVLPVPSTKRPKRTKSQRTLPPSPPPENLRRSKRFTPY